jgi:hypothetical protein
MDNTVVESTVDTANTTAEVVAEIVKAGMSKTVLAMIIGGSILSVAAIGGGVYWYAKRRAAKKAKAIKTMNAEVIDLDTGAVAA